MTTQFCFIMGIKATGAYENMRIYYYIYIAVNLLHVSVTFCGIFVHWFGCL